jgi:hypothetical protein
MKLFDPCELPELVDVDVSSQALDDTFLAQGILTKLVGEGDAAWDLEPDFITDNAS